MAAGTALSRVTGLLRTASLAAALGVTGLSDAYNASTTLSVMLFVLVTGGTLSAVLVPILAREDDPEARRRSAETVGGLVLLVTGAMTLLALVGAPVFARIFALGLRGDPSYDDFVSVTTTWLVLAAPQVLFWGISVYAVAVLNAHGRLALAGFAPVATNLVTIAAVWAYVVSGAPDPPALAEVGTVPLLVLGLGTTLGVAAMAVPQLVGATRVLPGLRLRPRLRRGDPTTREVVRLGRWTLLYVAANQVGLAVVLVLAKSVEGGVTAYQWAFAIMQLPFAIVAVSLFSAIFPRLARTAGSDDARFADTVSGGLRLSALLMVPAAAGMAVLAEPLADVLLGYGAARGSGAAFVATVLRVFAFALVPFTVFQLLTRSFYALSDARRPALVNLAVNGVNIVAAVVAFAAVDRPRDRLAGLVVAYALSYVTGCLLLGAQLRRLRPGSFARGGRAFGTAAGAAAAMATAVALGLSAWPEPSGSVAVAVRTVTMVALGGVVYLGTCLALRSPELTELGRIRRRREA